MDFGAKALRYAGRDIPVLCRADCCVAGGGPSGTAAAILAARRGLKTVLIERGVALGGLSTLGLVAPFMPTNCAGSETPYVWPRLRDACGNTISRCRMA